MKTLIILGLLLFTAKAYSQQNIADSVATNPVTITVETTQIVSAISDRRLIGLKSIDFVAVDGVYLGSDFEFDPKKGIIYLPLSAGQKVIISFKNQ